MYDTESLKKFIVTTLQNAFDNPELYSKEAVIETILYRVDLVEKWKE